MEAEGAEDVAPTEEEEAADKIEERVKVKDKTEVKGQGQVEAKGTPDTGHLDMLTFPHLSPAFVTGHTGNQLIFV